MGYGRLKPGSPYHQLTHNEVVDMRRGKRMDEIDRLDAATRALVHDYGYTIVKTLRDVGVVKPAQIKHVVETVLNEFSPTRGSFSRQGIRTEIET